MTIDANVIADEENVTDNLGSRDQIFQMAGKTQ